MKASTILKALFILLLLFYSIVIIAQTKELPFAPTIKYDIAIFSGKIERMGTDQQPFKSINISFYSVLTGDLMNYDIPVDNDGTFRAKILVECTTLANIESDYYNGLACLIPSEESKLRIFHDGDQNKRVEFKNSIGFTADDANAIDNWPWELPIIGNEIISPEAFSQTILDGMQKMLISINSNDKLTPFAKQFIASGIKYYVVAHALLKYDEYINTTYRIQNKADTLNEKFKPQVPDKSYYSFLKYFDLNDPFFLTSAFYPLVLRQIQNIETLAIPDIGEQPVALWQSKVKQIMKDKLGFENGIVYDIMACYSYVKQLNYLNPLSEIQKKNIQSYFSNKSFAEILFAKNEKVLQEAEAKGKAKSYKLSGASEQMMDSIIAKYRGKVVFVDFWATWCMPCQKAMLESEPVRKEFENKEVAFLFLTDTSSPEKLWEQKISAIRGEHYYLPKKEMNYIYKLYNFTAIPHYLIFDKVGVLKHNFGHYQMGNEIMRKWIQESL